MRMSICTRLLFTVHVILSQFYIICIETCQNVFRLFTLAPRYTKDMVNSYPDFVNNTNKTTKQYQNNESENDEEVDGDDEESISSSVASGFSEDNDDGISNSEEENGDVEEPAKKLQRLDEFAKELKKQHEEFIPARNQAIQKWNDKTRISAGRVKSANFSAFDQSTLKQIEQILCDKSRLIKRTQTKRSVYNIVGNDTDTNMKVEQTTELDPEIFDDDDFYHKLLREFIEQKSSDITNPKQMGQQWIELQKIRSKMKRSVDVKATKGRRLRYTTHTKLVNFMAPMPYNSWTDEAEAELFSSLFGEIRQK